MRRRALIVASLMLGASIGTPTPADAHPLAGQRLFGDVLHYVRLGPRAHLTGTSVDFGVQAWMRRAMSRAGLQTGVDGYDFYGFSVRRLRLVITGHRYRRIAAFYYAGRTGAWPRHARLAYAGAGTPSEVEAAGVKGRIAVVEVPYVADNALDPSFNQAFQNVEQAGAIGLIAVTQGPQDYPVNQDVDSRAGVQSLPTIFVGKHSGQRIVDAALAGKSASLLLDAEVSRRCTTNTWAILPGQNRRRYVIVGTPIGAWTPSASERGPGVAVLLGLVRHYASLPLSQRPLTLIFAALSGHEIGYLGLPTLMEIHPDWFSHTDAYVHLGASLAALQQVEKPDGQVAKLPGGDWTRALYVSENPLLQTGVQPAFAQAQPLGSLPPGGFDPGEQAYAYHAGIPIIAESGASYNFHTAGDQPSGVGLDLLHEQAESFAAAIDYVAGLPSGALRAANAPAAQLGAKQNPNPTPTGGGSESANYAPQPDPSCAR